eukprot:Tamp_10778.p1 GENE.Tamp_10778~~Tamp_10778.p1  ORF type:complete len:276 (+),score=51.45 Tamp_10778:358-1185(+)
MCRTATPEGARIFVLRPLHISYRPLHATPHPQAPPLLCRAATPYTPCPSPYVPSSTRCMWLGRVLPGAHGERGASVWRARVVQRRARRLAGTERAGQVELMALKVFEKGDNQYRAGKADINTVKSLRAAGQLFEVCTQFCPNGELPFDLNEKYIYAKVKAGEIFMCLKEGRTPQPPDDEMPMPPPDSMPPPMPPPDSRPPVIQQPPAARPPAQAPAPAGGGSQPPKIVHESKSAEAYTEMALAEKHTKYALSALQFDDVPEAIKNLKEALRILEK